MNMLLCAVNVSKDADLSRMSHKVVLVNPQDHSRCLDIDIGSWVTTRRVTIDRSGNFCFGRLARPILVLRKDYLRRSVFCNERPIPTYPATVTVSGTVYHVLLCAQNQKYCFGVEEGYFPTLMVPSPGGAPPARTVLQAYQSSAETSQSTVYFSHDNKVGFEITTDIASLFAGEALNTQPYGGVYKGRVLTAVTTVGDDLAADEAESCWYSPSPVQWVAVKSVRYSNTHLPGAPTAWYRETGELVQNAAPYRHGRVPPGTTLTTRDVLRNGALGPYLEHPMSEVEINSAAVEGWQEHLSGPCLFLDFETVAISSDHQHVATEFTPFGSVERCIHENSVLCDGLHESAIKHFIRAMLRGLHFLHSGGVVHRDVSLGNAVLRLPAALAPEQAAQLLRLLNARELTRDDIMLLDLAWIDFGVATVLVPVSLATPASLPYATTSITSIADVPRTPVSRLEIDSVSDGNSVGSAVGEGAYGMSCLHISTDSLLNAKPAAFEVVSPVSVNSSDVLSPAATSPGARWMTPLFARLQRPLCPIGKDSYRPPGLEYLANYGALPGTTPSADYDGPAADMWQVGVAMLYMITGLKNYVHLSEQGKRADILLNRLTLYSHAKVRPNGRPGLADLPVHLPDAHGGFNITLLSEVLTPQALDLLQLLLCFNPAHRWSAQQALQHPWFL
jgi:serine/threonine protein kinase